MKELIDKKFIQKENKEFSSGLGIIVTMFSKYFVPKSTLSEIQKKNLDLLKATNYRL
ncbi:hypothetical protein [uncultured Sneathia sp.]|jgi:hypothetical protein|nr:hypothetical protein [uncultured Sneathia sp.]